MRIIKKISAILLAVIILSLSLPTATVFADKSDMRYGRKALGEMPDGAHLQYAYDQLVAGCKIMEEKIKIDTTEWTVDFEEYASLIYEMFYYDYPEYFWVKSSHGWNSDDNILFPMYHFTKESLNSAQKKFNTKVAKLTKGLRGKSDYEKSKIIHDRLANTVTFEETVNDGNAYGAIVNGRAVCEGYAKAYQHLMNTVGIPSWIVYGTVKDGDYAHSWNIVKLYGSWYYTDVTWDDPGKNIYHEFLNITLEKLLKTRFIDDIFVNILPPTGNSPDVNFYKIEDREFTSYDQSKLVELLKKDNYKTQIYVHGDINEFLSLADKNALSIAVDLGAKGDYTSSISSYSLMSAATIEITITDNNTNKTPSKPTTSSKDDITSTMTDNTSGDSDSNECTKKSITDTTTKEDSDDDKSNKNALKYIIIGGATAIIIAGVVVTIIFINKKRA